MIYEGYRDQHKFNGMEVVVLPDDDERLKELKPGCIGADMNHFYVSESMWETLKEQLFALRSNDQAEGRAACGESRSSAELGGTPKD